MSDRLAALYQTVHITKDKEKPEFKVQSRGWDSAQHKSNYMGCSGNYDV